MNQIFIRTGSEGPPHDPYHYEEITVLGRNGKVTMHSGLAVWISVDGRKHYVGNGTQMSDMHIVEEFQQLTGIYPWVAERAYRQAPYKRHKRKCRHSIYERVSGMPGETMVICRKCQSVVDYSFNMGSIQ
jgi:hypothetical protein